MRIFALYPEFRTLVDIKYFFAKYLTFSRLNRTTFKDRRPQWFDCKYYCLPCAIKSAKPQWPLSSFLVRTKEKDGISLIINMINWPCLSNQFLCSLRAINSIIYFKKSTWSCSDLVVIDHCITRDRRYSKDEWNKEVIQLYRQVPSMIFTCNVMRTG